MATWKQVSANRRNALKSTGPTTEAGKQTVSQNALVHGLRAQVTVFPGEDQKEYEELADLLRSQYQPESGFEASLVDRVTHCLWRLRRGPQIEVGIFLAEQLKRIEQPSYIVEGRKSKSVEFQNDANTSHPGALDLADAYGRIANLYRYEAHLDKTLRTNLELLERTQYVRKSGMDPYYLSKLKFLPASGQAKTVDFADARSTQIPMINNELLRVEQTARDGPQSDSAKQSQFVGSSSIVNNLNRRETAEKKVA